MSHRSWSPTFGVVILLLSCVPASLFAQTTGIREVTASDRNLIALHTRLRYTTMIVLPDGEEILDGQKRMGEPVVEGAEAGGREMRVRARARRSGRNARGKDARRLQHPIACQRNMTPAAATNPPARRSATCPGRQ